MKLFHDLSQTAFLNNGSFAGFAISLNKMLLWIQQSVTKTNYRRMLFKKQKSHCIARMILMGLMFVSLNISAQLEQNFSANVYCVCNDDQSGNGAGDGTFNETLVFTGPCGLEVYTGSGSQPPALASLPFTSSSPDPMTGAL